MFIVGLTGGLATGKSTVLKIFSEHGIPVIDADEIARDVVEPGRPAWHLIRKEFGESVFHDDGKLNRNAMGAVIFDDADKRTRLNNITHPRIQKTIMRMALRHLLQGHPFIVMELPLLFETRRMMNFMHKIVTVVCEDSQQLERLCQRNEFEPVMAKKRIDSQMPLEEKVANSNFVIDNTGTFAETRIQTEKIIRVLRSYRYHWVLRSIVIVTVLTIPTIAICAYNFFKTKSE